MKKYLVLPVAMAAAIATSTASAFWGGNNNNYECYYNPYDCNPYDEWDPRYWMEEFSDMWDDNNYGPWGGYGYRPYGAAPYGMPYYGGAAPAAPYAAPYGMPRPPFAQVPQPRVAPQAAPAPAPAAPEAAK